MAGFLSTLGSMLAPIAAKTLGDIGSGVISTIGNIGTSKLADVQKRVGGVDINQRINQLYEQERELDDRVGRIEEKVMRPRTKKKRQYEKMEEENPE